MSGHHYAVEDRKADADAHLAEARTQNTGNGILGIRQKIKLRDSWRDSAVFLFCLNIENSYGIIHEVTISWRLRRNIRLLFTPVSITPLIDTEDACFDLNASRPIAKGDLKWRDALLVAHRVNSNRLLTFRCLHYTIEGVKFLLRKWRKINWDY